MLHLTRLEEFQCAVEMLTVAQICCLPVSPGVSVCALVLFWACEDTTFDGYPSSQVIAAGSVQLVLPTDHRILRDINLLRTGTYVTGLNTLESRCV